MDASDGQSVETLMSDDSANTPSGDAQDLAAEALLAAQAAVSSLNTQSTETNAASGGDDAAVAALLAAQQAIEAARSMNPSLGSPPSTPASHGSSMPPPAASRVTAQPLNLPSFAPPAATQKPEGIDLLSDVNLNVKIELGRTRMLVEDVLRLGEGSVVELDKLAGDPVDVYVNDRHVARGEVLVLNDNFCVRINEIIALVADEAPKR
ncbi:MAG: flagellar motor switch protein FliN [Phycisphaerales bacterium]|nr:flagellar motor switch protein FliN [Phycisphaerales bacterium]